MVYSVYFSIYLFKLYLFTDAHIAKVAQPMLFNRPVNLGKLSSSQEFIYS